MMFCGAFLPAGIIKPFLYTNIASATVAKKLLCDMNPHGISTLSMSEVLISFENLFLNTSQFLLIQHSLYCLYDPQSLEAFKHFFFLR